jgi:hypothetical protein
MALAQANSNHEINHIPLKVDVPIDKDTVLELLGLDESTFYYMLE